MPQVALRINGRSYEITCQDGQEEHLRGVGAYFDTRVRQVAEAVGQVGEGRLLVIAALLLADELFETRERLKGLSGQDAGSGQDTGSGPDAGEAAEKLDQAAALIETLARRLEQA